MVIDDDNDNDDGQDSIVPARLGSIGIEFMGEAYSSEMATSSASNSDSRPTTNDSQPVEFTWGSMIERRIEELALRYGVPLNYIYKVPSFEEYVSTPLEIDVCKETFKARFMFSVHPFVEELLSRYGLVLA